MDVAVGIDRRLAWLTWTVMAGAVVVDLSITGWTLQPDRVSVMAFCLAFFAVLVVRLAVSMRLSPGRRLPTSMLMLGMVLWAAESAALQVAQEGGASSSPGLGEIAFLACYPVLAFFLLLDTRRPSRAVGTWLEAAILCGGSGCAAGVLLVTPFVGHSDHALPRLVALTYPVLDVMLALLVVAQVALGVRGRDRVSALLVGGFTLLAVADTSFIDNVVHGSEGSTVATVVLWGAGFALIVSASCRAARSATRALTSDVPAPVLIVASLAALGALVVRPDGPFGWYLIIPAVMTLLATAGRLVVALRDARGAAAAIVLSQTDELTGLPNRRAILARLEEAWTRAAPFALMIMDLDGFKDINDTLGHGAGDAILRLCASRMRQVIPASTMVARLGGDEFAFVAPLSDEIELLELANLAVEALRTPTVLEGIELVIDASVGIAARVPADENSSALLRRADIAMYQAKAAGGGPMLYDATRDLFSRGRLRITEELRRGINDQQLEVWYQPQIDASTQAVVGMEALVRWQHPVSGLLMPPDFLPAARHAGLMPLLGEAVIARSAIDLESWRSAGLDLTVALNCAPPELLSGIFVRQLLEALERHDLCPSDIVLEVTEDSFLADPERARSVLTEARTNGLQVSIDDYGTGFSSLTYLRDLSVDELKMDRSFVSTMATDPRSRMIVESTVRMAHALDLRVVIEGVEDAATSAMVVAMGADTIQGYHFAKALPGDQVLAWVSAWNRGLLGATPIDRRREAG